MHLNVQVGKKGFEPLCNQLLFLQGISLRRYMPISEPERIRTFDRLLRREVLYPAELRARLRVLILNKAKN